MRAGHAVTMTLGILDGTQGRMNVTGIFDARRIKDRQQRVRRGWQSVFEF